MGKEGYENEHKGFNCFFSFYSYTKHTKHLLSRSVALITSAATFDHSTLSQVKIEHWFADVFWLTPAGVHAVAGRVHAVAGRGSSLVYPYKSFGFFSFGVFFLFLDSPLITRLDGNAWPVNGNILRYLPICGDSRHLP
jgi:hypothetical protein